MTTAQFNSCVDEFADRLFRFILKNIRDEEKAKDIVQDSFTKMWEKVSDIAAEKARSYLFTTAYHTMIDYIRQDNKFTEDSLALETLVTNDNHFNDLKEILEEALTKLPEIQRSVILLRDYEGYSYKEIGVITGLNEAQVKVYIYRGRSLLKNYIVKVENVI
ncbi:MAG: RNA polymerase sigma factor [Bacteroidales bacterium]|nr:RNA polymerase sigma factor [Bacteroidales bacterium]